jgi:fucose permease
MNLMHAAFCVGAVLSPFAVSALVAAGSTWQMMFRLIALASVLMAGAMAALPFSRLHPRDEERAAEPAVMELLRQPLLVLCSLVLLVYVGVELGVSSWVAEYYVAVLRQDASVGALMVSVFWIGLLIGRAAVSAWYHGTRQAELLLSLAAVSAVGLLMALLLPGAWAAGAGFLVTGLGYSAIYPAVMALVGRQFSRGQSVAVGIAGTGGGIGSFVFPFVMAAIAHYFGIRRGFFFYVALNVVMLGLIAAVTGLVRKTEKG